MHVTKSPTASDTEIIHNSKLHKYINNNKFVSVAYSFKFVKPSLWLKEGVEDEQKVAPVAGMFSKAAAYSSALHQLGIVQTLLPRFQTLRRHHILLTCLTPIGSAIQETPDLTSARTLQGSSKNCTWRAR